MQKKIKKISSTKDKFRHFQLVVGMVFVVFVGLICFYKAPKENKAVAHTENSFLQEEYLSEDSIGFFDTPDSEAEAAYVQTLIEEKRRLEKDKQSYMEMMEYYKDDSEKKIVYEKKKIKVVKEIEAISFKIQTLEQGAKE